MTGTYPQSRGHAVGPVKRMLEAATDPVEGIYRRRPFLPKMQA